MGIIKFIQTLGTAEIIIGIALIVMCLIGCFDSSKFDKKTKQDIKRFNDNINFTKNNQKPKNQKS